MSNGLSPEKALIFRITHRDNVPWILENGLHCKNAGLIDPHYVAIGDPELIDRRSRHPVPCAPGGTLSDYIPFYFTPFSPMLYKIRTGHGGIRRRENDEIVILASSLRKLKENTVPFLFTDRHALLAAAQFYSDLIRLDQIDWPLLQQRDFKRDPEDPGKVERYQAEALIHNYLPIDSLLGVVCYNDAVAKTLKTHIERRGLAVDIATRPGWYFS